MSLAIFVLDKADDEDGIVSSPAPTETIASGSVEQAEVEKWKNNYKELQERSKEIASGLQNEVKAKDSEIALRDKLMKEMEANNEEKNSKIKELDARIKELEERLAYKVTVEEAGVIIKREVGVEELEVVRLRKENCELKVSNPSGHCLSLIFLYRSHFDQF